MQGQNHPVVAPVASGGAIVAWIDNRQGGNQVYGQRFNFDGSIAWPDTGARLGAKLGESYLVIAPMTSVAYPPVADEGAIVAFDDDRNTPAYLPDVRAHAVDGSGALLAGWGAGDGLVVSSTTERTQTAPVIATDMYDGAFVAWQDDRNFANQTHFDIYLTRLRWDGMTVLDVPRPTASALAFTVSPNPTSGPVRFNLRVAAPSQCSIRLLDVQGRCAAVVLEPTEMLPGSHEFEWNGQLSDGTPARPGIYFASYRVNGTLGTKRLALLH